MTFESLWQSLPLSVWIWVIQMLGYHGFGLMFEIMDQRGLLARYKVRLPDRLTYFQVMPRVLANQVFLLLPCMVLVEYAGLAFVGEPHLPWYMYVVALVGMSLGHDFVQYASHRFLLHRPSLMRRLGHEVHHTATASRSVSACYMSGPDFFFEIVLPYLVPLIVIGGGGADVLLHTIMVVGGAFGGLYEHSGYDFSVHLRARNAAGQGNIVTKVVAQMISSHAHGEHHRRGTVSFSDGFGSTSISDSVLKTRWDLVPERMRQSQRDQSSS